MPPECSFPRPALIKLNHLPIGIDLFLSEMDKRGMAAMAACEFGAKEQIAEHIIKCCSICHHPNRNRVL